MTVVENAIVVDKNVWLDFYLHERPLHKEAVRFIQVAEKNNANLAAPADALKDVFFIAGQHMKRLVRDNGGSIDECTARAIADFAWRCVDHMTGLAVSVPLDERTVWLARHQRDITSDYEDASVLAACELCKARYLVTHDKDLARQASIAAKTASEMADLIERAHQD